MEDYIAIKRSDLIEYTYYDDDGTLIGVLNKSKLKELIEVDKVILEETEHKDKDKYILKCMYFLFNHYI